MFEVKILVADLPAKASILNIKQFNAYFGCSHCLIKRKSIGEGNRGLFYPNQRNMMRTKEKHEEYLNLIQNEGLSSFRGVRGPSAVADIVDNLPLSAPIDYMHEVLLGVTRTLLFAVKNKTNQLGLGRIRKAIEGIQLTSDFKKSLRCLDELEYLKANELKVWLLYIGPVVLVGNVNAVLYERFHLLSYNTRLLLFSSQHCLLFDQLIKRFHSLTAEAHTEKAFSPNIHSLNHLSWQVSCYGPLWCTSAIMFESANYLLKCKFTGTVNHLRLLVERYVRNNMSSRKVPQKDPLYDLCFNLRKQKCFRRRSINLHQVPFDLQHLNAYFYSNQKLQNFHLDSQINTSSKNSYVSFVSGNEKTVGQVRVFFVQDSQDYASIQIFNVVSHFWRAELICDVCSYYEVLECQNPKSVTSNSIFEKLQLVKLEDNLFLLPLVNVFEHD